MKRKWKEQLKSMYAAPPPLRKREFVRKWNPPQMSVWEFLFLQAAYIRKWIWGISAAVFAAAMFGSIVEWKNSVWMISALTPLLAVTVVSECGRSEHYGMAELETATRFSLRSVLFARLGILGIENLAVLGLLLAVGTGNAVLGPVQAGAYIVTPYLLTAFIGLYIVRRVKGQEAMYFSVGAAVCIGVSVFLFRDVLMGIYQADGHLWWGCGALLCGVGAVRQYGSIMKETEDAV